MARWLVRRDAMRRAFTVIELLVVIAVISLLMAITVPALRRARQQGDETVCRSKLRQLAFIMKTYTNDHDGLFPNPRYIYHSAVSFESDPWEESYPRCCRWHDARMAWDSNLLREHPELRGALWPYLGNKEILLCKVGKRAIDPRPCQNGCPWCGHDPNIPVETQYTYTTNFFLGNTLTTGKTTTGSATGPLDRRTLRETAVRRETQVTRSPSQVFVFAEENSWAVNTTGLHGLTSDFPGAIAGPGAPADYNLSGAPCVWGGATGIPTGELGTLRWPICQIVSSYFVHKQKEIRHISSVGTPAPLGEAFATYHRPKRGDLYTGFSFVSMLDGHVQKVTVADQLRKSKRVAGLEDSQLGPGGNLALAWPLDIPPPGGWENQ
jgi:prepilin-type N-terminal cleavage/methylation domain-containing protein